MRIKRATTKDLEEILRLNKALFKYERQFGKTYNMRWTYSKIGKDYFKKRLTHKNGICLVAEEKGEIVGYLVGWIDKYAYRSVNPICEIENFYVEEEFRRKGVGSKLVREMMRIVEERGVKRLKVDPLFKNKFSINIYRKMGFEGHSLVWNSTCKIYDAEKICRISKENFRYFKRNLLDEES